MSKALATILVLACGLSFAGPIPTPVAGTGALIYKNPNTASNSSATSVTVTAPTGPITVNGSNVLTSASLTINASDPWRLNNTATGLELEGIGGTWVLPTLLTLDGSTSTTGNATVGGTFYAGTLRESAARAVIPSRVTAGTGISLSTSDPNGTVQVTNSAPSPNMVTTTATINPALIASLGYADSAVTVTGATNGNDVIVTPTTTPEGGLVWNGFVSSDDTVTLRITNASGAGIDPASRSWRVTVTLR